MGGAMQELGKGASEPLQPKSHQPQTLAADMIDIGYGGISFFGVVLSIAVAALIQNFSASGEDSVILARAAVPWIDEAPEPLLIAATVFTVQSIVALSSLRLVLLWREFSKDPWGRRFVQSLRAYAGLSTFAAVIYILEFTLHKHIVARHSFYGDFLIVRNLHWLLATPWQWYIYGKLCTTADLDDLVLIFLLTVLVHFFAVLMLVASQPWLRTVLFSMSTCAFIEMLRRVSSLERIPDMARIGRRVFRFNIVWWSLYPIVAFLRMLGYLSPWSEQILAYTMLDIVAKAVTFTLIVVCRFIQFLSRVNGTLQLVLSSHDIILVVDNDFQILQGPQSVPLVAHYLGNLYDRTLLDICSPEHRCRLIEAARVADSQRFSTTTPKCVVQFMLPTGQEMLVECLVSKCLEGSRMIGIIVTKVGSVAEDHADDASEVLTYAELHDVGSRSVDLQGFAGTQQSKVLVPGRDPFANDLQATLSIHNCCELLQASAGTRQLLQDMFTQTHCLCALVCWDLEQEALQEATVVLLSPLLRMLFFRSDEVPMPFSKLMDPASAALFGSPLKAGEVILYQRANVVLPTGVPTKCTVMQLNNMSSSDAAGSHIRLQVCVFQLAPHISSGGQNRVASQYFWYYAGARLVCIEADDYHHVSPPVPLQGMEDGDSSTGPGGGWHLFFNLPAEPAEVAGKSHSDDGQQSSNGKEEELGSRLLLAVRDRSLPGGLTCAQLFEGHSPDEVKRRLAAATQKQETEGPIPDILLPFVQQVEPRQTQVSTWLMSPRSGTSSFRGCL